MKGKMFTGLVFVVLLVTSVVVHIPASFALRYLPSSTGADFSGVSGTLWNGSVKQFTWQGQPLGTLNWTLNVLPLFTGKADVSVRLAGSGLSARGSVGYGFDGVFAKQLLLSAPASFIQSYVPYPLPVGLSGQFDITVRDYLMSEPFCDTLDGNIAWSQGSVSSPLGNVDPGLVVADVTCDEGSLVLNGDSKSDALQSEFTLSLDPSQRYKIDGWFIPGDALPDSMKNQLSWLGKPDNEGRYRLSFGS